MSGGSSPSMSVPNVFVVWLWENDGKSFDLYTPEYSTQIEKAYQQQRPTLTITENNWLIDFTAKTQTNTSTNVRRKIIRILPTVDDLCNLIYDNTALSDYRYKPYWVFTDGSWENNPSVFTVDHSFKYKQYRSSIINSTSSIGFTPLFTACRNHSSIELIDFLIKNTDNIHQMCGLNPQNTAAHAVAYSYLITPIDIIRNGNSHNAHVAYTNDYNHSRSIEDKLKILKLFENVNFDFKMMNSYEETVWDLIYETETIKYRKTIIDTNGLSTKFFTKYTPKNVSDSYILAKGWIQRSDSSTGRLFYVNMSVSPHVTTWDEPALKI
jgi:hypothetical protein